MKKFFLALTFFMLVFSPCLLSKVQVGKEVLEKYETPHPYKGVKGVVWEKEFHWPKAGYIAIHFSKFDLAKGDYVDISSPDGKFAYTYKGKGKETKRSGGETVSISKFWTTRIPGDTAIVRLYSQNLDSRWGFVIDKWARGYEREHIKALMAKSDAKAICNGDDKEWAKCYDGTIMYEKSKAVCRILINGIYGCTGFLIGSEGHVITNQHCIGSQSDADNSDFEFMAEGSTCSTDCSDWFDCPGTIEATSGSLIKADYSLDYALVLLPNNVTSIYGYLQFRETLPPIGERIYVPQHPGAYGKQLAVNSDIDGPYAKIHSTDQPACHPGGPDDIGYYADTQNGSSGSPVISYNDHLVVALHHCADCPNRGVPIPSIISHLGTDLPTGAVPYRLVIIPKFWFYVAVILIDPPPCDPLDVYKNSLSMGAYMELPTSRNFSLLFHGGYNSYKSEKGVSLRIINASLNGKFYLNKGNIRLFVKGGAGYYWFNPSDGSNPGYNLGGGLQLQLIKRLVLEVEYNFHNVFQSGMDTRFSFLSTGIKIL